jgi:alkylation response protein AidB-like acyl-CoA dehydrogenase
MQFTFTEEQQEFRAVLRRYFAESSPTTTVRRLMESEAGWDAAQWREMNQQLGLCGVHVPEQFGGQGFSFVELGIVLEEMGRALVCAPYFASAVLAATAIMNTATDAQKTALLPRIVSGETIATLAFTEPNGRWDVGGGEGGGPPAAGQ